MIQSKIDALPNGGVISLPIGNFSAEPALRLRTDVTIRGAGARLTTIPAISRVTSRLYHCVLEDLAVDCHGGYIAIDWTNITLGSIKRVLALNAQYGMLLSSNSECNKIEELNTAGITVEGIELYNSGNQNTFVGGRINAPLCIRIINSNGNTFVGTSLEGDTVQHFLKRESETIGTTMCGVRCEIDGVRGPFWLNGMDQTWSDASA